MVDVGDVDRPAARGDAAREAPADRDPHAALDLLLEALGGARDELLGIVVEQQDGGRVDARMSFARVSSSSSSASRASSASAGSASR